MEKYGYRFSFGPWNIHEGADPFGPPIRPTVPFDKKLEAYQRLFRRAVPDDDAVPDLTIGAANRGRARALKAARQPGLAAELRRAWAPLTVDGAYTANDPVARAYARERSHKMLDIAQALGTGLSWCGAREGTCARQRRRPRRICSPRRLTTCRQRRGGFAVEPKPNEPMDLHSHHRARRRAASRPKTRRIGVLVESFARCPGRTRSTDRWLTYGAVECAPQRPERPEVRPGSLVRRGQPAPGVRPGARAGRSQVYKTASSGGKGAHAGRGRRSTCATAWRRPVVDACS